MEHIQTKERKKLSAQTFVFPSKPRIIGNYSIVGRREGEGPLGKYFDKIVDDSAYGEKTYEKAEARFFFDAMNGALKNAGLEGSELDAILGGDLLNQIVSTNYVARCFDTGFLGLYGACSTMAQSLLLGSVLIDGGYCEKVLCLTGSHFATAERQYRGPMELGNQRAPYSQWTTTGSGCSILGATGDGVKVSAATIGKVQDYGITDVINMGAAMAPAAVKTMTEHFKATKTNPDDYDMIVTGDLAKLGSDIVRELIKKEGYRLGQNYKDCGQLLYYCTQETAQGGSGCGCSAVIINSYILNKLKQGELKKVLFLGTGALMSTTVSQQGESIPGIAHAVVLEA